MDGVPVLTAIDRVWLQVTAPVLDGLSERFLLETLKVFFAHGIDQMSLV